MSDKFSGRRKIKRLSLVKKIVKNDAEKSKKEVLDILNKIRKLSQTVDQNFNQATQFFNLASIEARKISELKVNSVANRLYFSQGCLELSLNFEKQNKSLLSDRDFWIDQKVVQVNELRKQQLKISMIEELIVKSNKIINALNQSIEATDLEELNSVCIARSEV